MSVNSGSSGQRGSRWYVGEGQPNDQNVPSDVQLMDLFIDSASGKVYQLVLLPSNVQGWTEVFQLSAGQTSGVTRHLELTGRNEPDQHTIDSITGLREALDAAIGGEAVTDHRLLNYRDAANSHPIAAITGLQAALDSKTNDHDKLENRNSPDQHPISAITGLQAALDARTATTSHTDLTNRDDPDSHPIAAITGLQDELDAKSTVKDHDDLTNKNAPDQHTIAAITGLQTALDSKSTVKSHSELTNRNDSKAHTIDAIDGLREALNQAQGGQGISNHTLLTNRSDPDSHPISAITGLSQALSDASAVPSHAQLSGRDATNSHPIAAITGLQSALDSKSTAKDHSQLTGRTSADAHPISSITGLQSALDAKSSVKVHSELTGRTDPDSHPISAITGLQAALDAAASGTGVTPYDESVMRGVYSTSGGRILDPNGNKFLPLGFHIAVTNNANPLGGWPYGKVAQLKSRWPGMNSVIIDAAFVKAARMASWWAPNSRTSTVTYKGQTMEQWRADLLSLIDECRAAGLHTYIVSRDGMSLWIMEENDPATGRPYLEQVRDAYLWLHSIYKNDPGVEYNLLNEPYTGSDATWINGHNYLINPLREAGYAGTITLDPRGNAQDPDASFVTLANQLDDRRGIICGLHPYGGWQRWMASDTGFQQYIDNVNTAGYPVLFGEFGANTLPSQQGDPVDQPGEEKYEVTRRVLGFMRASQAGGLGWHAHNNDGLRFVSGDNRAAWDRQLDGSVDTWLGREFADVMVANMYLGAR